MNNFTYKKIGIWGFGIVGKSVLRFFDAMDVTSIEIIDTKSIDLPTTKNIVRTVLQTPESISLFLENNDIILVSPGIALHAYQQFAHKFIAELDLYQQFASWQTVAITGSLGKTSITHLLTNILQQMSLLAVSAGNIGYPMLDLCNNKKKLDLVILELSSFQLHQAKTFAPDLAIITNIYENHLDHHQNMHEYCMAKCNIFAQQSPKQKALLPLDIIDIIKDNFAIRANWSFFSTDKPTCLQLKKYKDAIIYYVHDQKVYRYCDNHASCMFDLTDMPALTFDANWLVIIAALDLQNIDLKDLVTIAQQLDIPDHRLQKIATHQGYNFYNDSKSTVWQATLQAVISIEKTTNNPIKLFVGGLSKGADRTPLFQALAYKNIEIFAFGGQADQLASLCQKFNIAHHAHPTLDASWQACIASLQAPCQILFSPGGASFDLFSDYKMRGKYFTELVQNFCKTCD